MSPVPDEHKRHCTLLLFVATPSEETGLKEAAERQYGLRFEKIRDPILGEYHWLGEVGNETVIAIRPARERGRIAMGEIGRLGSAAKGIRFRDATGAKGIVQLGMGFGIDPQEQELGDVMVSSSLIPYDNRLVMPQKRHRAFRLFGGDRYMTDYSPAVRQPARPELVNLFLRELRRGSERAFEIHVGAMLSGAAVIRSRLFRNELLAGVPDGEDQIVGGEMEGVGLLAASVEADDPVWCIVKGIADFADHNRDAEIEEARPVACRNAAEFVLSALVNDPKS